MTPATLTAVGRALYGNSWQKSLAEALGVSDRTLRHWLSGQRNIPENILPACRLLCAHSSKRLSAMAEMLAKKIAQDA